MTKLIERTSWLTGLSLLTSLSTLVCCALPALLVTLGAGAALAGLVAAVPQLIWLSEHKTIVFAAAGLLLLTAGIWRWHSRHAPCPADARLAASCARLRRVSFVLYIVSLAVYGTGFFFAFVAVRLF